MSAPQVDPIIAPLLQTSAGRNALREVVKLAKMSNKVDVKIDRHGTKASNSIGKLTELENNGINKHLANQGVPNGSTNMFAALAPGGTVIEGFGLNGMIQNIRTNAIIDTLKEVGAQGVPVSASIPAPPNPVIAGAEMIGGAAMIAVGVSHLARAVTHDRINRQAGDFLDQSKVTRDALEVAGFEGAQDSQGLDDLMQAATADIGGLNSAIRVAERSAPREQRVAHDFSR